MAGTYHAESTKIFDQILRAQAHGGYVTLYVALLSSAPAATDDGSDTAAKEVVYTSYARVAITAGTGVFDAPAAGATENTGAITFPQCTGLTDTATHWAILDGLAGDDNDDPIFYGELTAPLAISNLITPAFAAGDLDFVMT